MSFFESLEHLSDDPILSIPKFFLADPRPNKVNLGIGSYKDSEGVPYVLDCVREAESALLKKKPNKEYLPIEGDSELIQLSKHLIYGTQFEDNFWERLFLTQTIGGTGALSLAAQLLSKKCRIVYLPNPTWPNHLLLLTQSDLHIEHYSYYHYKSHLFNFEKMSQEITKMVPGNLILLHVCCHNPTGIDPTNEEWMKLSALIKKQELIPFFDFAYQGFKTSTEEDAFPIRYFASEGHELVVASSFAKNFGLYGERVGTLSVLTKNKDSTKKVESQLKQLIRSHYSTPPRHGAEIIAHILASQPLKKEWTIELATMRERLKEMRHTLTAGLQAKGTADHNWSFLDKQNGFFSFCGLSELQVHQLIKEYAIYMPTNGRINVGGLNPHNMDDVIHAILNVMER